MNITNIDEKIASWLEGIRAGMLDFYAHRGMRCYDCKTMRPTVPMVVESTYESPNGELTWQVKSWRTEAARDGWVDLDSAGKRTSFCPACSTKRNLVLPDMKQE